MGDGLQHTVQQINLCYFAAIGRLCYIVDANDSAYYLSSPLIAATRTCRLGDALAYASGRTFSIPFADISVSNQTARYSLSAATDANRLYRRGVGNPSSGGLFSAAEQPPLSLCVLLSGHAVTSIFIFFMRNAVSSCSPHYSLYLRCIPFSLYTSYVKHILTYLVPFTMPFPRPHTAGRRLNNTVTRWNTCIWEPPWPHTGTCRTAPHPRTPAHTAPGPHGPPQPPHACTSRWAPLGDICYLCGAPPPLPPRLCLHTHTHHARCAPRLLCCLLLYLSLLPTLPPPAHCHALRLSLSTRLRSATPFRAHAALLLLLHLRCPSSPCRLFTLPAACPPLLPCLFSHILSHLTASSYAPLHCDLKPQDSCLLVHASILNHYGFFSWF